MRLMYVVSGKRQTAQALDRVEALFADEAQMSGEAWCWIPERQNDIELERVTFRYAPDKPIVINGVSLSLSLRVQSGSCGCQW